MIKKILLLISLTLVESVALHAMNRSTVTTQAAQTYRQGQGVSFSKVWRKRLLFKRLRIAQRRALVGKHIRTWLWHLIPDRTDEDLGGYSTVPCAIL